MQLFQKLLGKKANSKGITALSFTPDGIAIAISQFDENQIPKLIHCEYIDTKNKQSVLNELTVLHHLNSYDCYVVMASDEYRLITIEYPAVAANELSEAIRWKISDLIEFQVDDAILDYYPLPESQRANSEKMLEVIASQNSTVNALTDLCLNNDLQLKSSIYKKPL